MPATTAKSSATTPRIDSLVEIIIQHILCTMARLSLVAVCLLALVCAPVVSAASSRRSLSQTATTARSKSKSKGKGGSGPPGE
jgi:hypothetical protein